MWGQIQTDLPAAQIRISIDTLPPAPDTLAPAPLPDTLLAPPARTVRLSAEGLDAVVDYGARDSMWFDVRNKQLHLWGEAFVRYTTLEVKAGYILMDYNINELRALPFADTSGQKDGIPQFQDKDQQFTAGEIRYNFRARKGKIVGARTQQEDLYVLGENAKFIGATDSDKSRNTIYNKNALITTCDHEHPHFGIRTRKLKVVPDKLVVAGVSNLEIGGVPTPLVLPFGFYPITQQRKAGLIIPRDFERGREQGLGIRDFGWYQPINDHVDLTATFNAYVNGSWGANVGSRYNKRYANSGAINLSVNRIVLEDAQARRQGQSSIQLQWNHQQDPKAHPTRRFSGSVNLQTNNNQNRVQNDFVSVFQNQLRSNLNYSQLFPGRPFQFNAGFSHDQNTATRDMNISLPNADFTMQRIFPFKRKNPIGNERWYEKITLTYNSALRNSIRTKDTLLFTPQAFDDLRVGIQHRASSDLNFKVLKYFNVAPTLSYEENWSPYTIRKTFDPTVVPVFREVQIGGETVFVLDSAATQWGRIDTRREWGFGNYRSYNAGVNANTVLFFTRQFKRGWFRGFRHTVKPNVSMGFGPDFSQPPYSGYNRVIPASSRPGRRDSLRYNIFEQSAFGIPPAGRRDLRLNYTIVNLLEMKVFGKKDTVARKIRIFDNLGFSGNYAFNADSLRWSTIGTGGLFRLFKGYTNLTWNLTLDPYVMDGAGRRVNRFVRREGGGLVRVSQFGVQLNTNLTVRQLRDLFREKSGAGSGAGAGGGRGTSDRFVDWFDDFSINHRVSFDLLRKPVALGQTRDTILIGAHNLSLNGGLPIGAKWRIDLRNISYDFPTKQIVYPDFSISRDLHCWQLSLAWQPSRGTYLFSINVRPGSLDFIKLPYRRNVFDARGRF